MDYFKLINPLVGYQWIRTQLEKRKFKCTVMINKPKMMIKGKLKDHKRNPYRIISFLGIPYALPPVNELRFQPPVSFRYGEYIRGYILEWEAYQYPECCIQYNPSTGSVMGSEDCLYLNVHIPHKPTQGQALLPVFVYIHGGAFSHGDANHLDLDLLIGKEKCVCVTIQYRLGALGFLNMRSDNCRGNAGMKDQVMALQWIRDNIQPFGGDPGNVTICGHSAGGSCVNFHMISPLSKGLFHKAIVQSGGIYCPWGYGGHARKMKLLFKREIGKENVVRHVVVKTFKEKRADELLKISERILNGILRMEPKKIFALLKPSVECIREGAFLPDPVETLMSAAVPVPTIAGIARQEGYMFYRTQIDRNLVSMVRKEEAFFKFLKCNFNWSTASVQDHLQTLRNMYFPYLYILSDAQILERLAALVTDIYFRRFYDNFNIGNLLESGSPMLYVYLFDYFSGERIVECSLNPLFQAKASEHGDDVSYLLYKDRVLRSLRNIKSREKRAKKVTEVSTVAERVNELWASFCRNGEPKCLGVNVEWRPHTEEKPCYLLIGKELSMMRGHLNEYRWAELNRICEDAEEIPSLESTSDQSYEDEDDGD